MSRADHPSMCCKPFNRLTPSGRVQSFHGFSCPNSPNKLMKPEPRRAEVASHALREDDVFYQEYWADRAYEIGEEK